MTRSNAAAALGYPVVMKVESPDLPHKTEAGVIRLNLGDADAVRAAYDRVMANAAKVSPPPRINGVLVQPMVPQGIELVIGARNDPLFGPLIVVGLGGILVEVLKDSALSPAPVSAQEAVGMLRQLKGLKLLEGFRGMAAVDVGSPGAGHQRGISFRRRSPRHGRRTGHQSADLRRRPDHRRGWADRSAAGVVGVRRWFGCSAFRHDCTISSIC